MRLRSLRRTLSVFLSFVLTFSILTVFESSRTPVAAAGLTSCADKAGVTSNVEVTSSQGQVFYIDSSSSQNLDASYIGYRVKATAAKTNIWVSVDGFKGGVIGLANQDDSTFSLGDISLNATKTAFFLLRAQASTKAIQTHTVHVYSGKPGLPTSTELHSCTFSFLKVQETIKANSNSISNIATVPASTSNLTLGSTFTVSMTGSTGTIGNGSSPDADIFWLSPTAKSNWPTQALRLESTLIKFSDTPSGVNSCSTEDLCQFTNKLLVSGLKSIANRIKNNAKSLDYQATFTFRVIGQSAAAVPLLPIAQISSGTQVKHTPLATSSIPTVGVNSISASNIKVKKSVASTSVINGSNTEFNYTVVIENNESSAISVDQINDTPASGLTYVANSASVKSYSTLSAGSPTSTVTPTEPYKPANSQDQVFVGPFTVPSGGRIELTYKMYVVTCSVTDYQYSNTATATIGTLIIGSTANTMSGTLATGTCTSTSITVTPVETTLPVDATTQPASALSTSTNATTGAVTANATLNATVDPNGQSGKAITFEYGKTPDLSGSTTVSVGNTTSGSTPYSVSSSLTGLSTGTIYYFRIRVEGVYGDILSFVTPEPVMTPTITTDDPTNVTQTGGTLNATIDPNQTSAYVSFTYSRTDPTLATGTTTQMVDDPTVAAGPSNPVTIFNGAYPTQVSLSTTDAIFGFTPAANDTIYYRANYTNASGVIQSSGTIKSFKLTSYLAQTITFNAITDKYINSGNLTLSPTTNAPGLAVTLESATTGICTVSGFVVTYVTDGSCTIFASQGGGLGSNSSYYSAAEQVSQTFTIKKVPQTVSFTSSAPANASFGGASYTPTGTSTDSVTSSSSGLTPVITSDTTSVCTISAGVVSFVGVGTCRLNINHPGNDTYIAATQVQQSFQVDRADRNLTASTDGTDADTWGTPSKKVSATADADNTDPKTFTSTDTSVCTVDASTGDLTLLKPGKCELVANISQGNRYKAKTSNTVSFNVDKKSQVLTGYNTTSAASASSVSMAVSTNATTNTSGLPSITYAIESGTNTAGCSVDSSGNVTFTKAGECYVTSENTGNAYWKSGTAKHKLTLNRADRVLTASTTGSNGVTWGTSGKSVSATATDNGSAADDSDTKTYSSVDENICTVNASTGAITLIKPGTCTLSATIAQGDRYLSKTSNTVSFTVAKKDHTLTGADKTSDASEPSVVMSVSSNANTNNSDLGTTTYSIESGTDTAGCVVDSSGNVTFTRAGECYVVASNVGNDFWKSGTSKHKLTLNRASRSITASTTGVNNLAWGTTGKKLSGTATADNDDEKTYTSVDSTVCTVNTTGDLTLLKPGTCTLSVTVKQGNRYLAATSSNISFTVAKKAHTLRGMFDQSTNISTASVSMAAESEADENIDNLASTTYEIESGTNTANCSVNSSGRVSFTQAGQCYVTATNGGNDYWGTATTKHKLVVNNKLNRSLTLATTSPTTLVWGASGKKVTAEATADDSDAKTFVSDDPDVCSVDASGNLTFKKPGHCVITSTVAENSNYNSAVSNSITFQVDHAERTLTASTNGADGVLWGASDKKVSAVASADDTDGKTYTSADENICSVDLSGNLTLHKPGVCTLTASIAQGTYYHGKSASPVSFRIDKKDHVLNGHNKTVLATTNSTSMSVVSDSDANNSDLATTTYSIESGTNTAGCSVDSSGNVSFTKAGECYVLSSNSGNDYWKTGTGRHKLTLNRADRTLTASTTGNNGVVWGTSGKTVSAVAEDNGSPADDSDAKTYTSADTSVCTVDSSGNLTLHKSGTCSLTAQIAAGNKYNSKTSNTVSFNVGKKSHSLSGMADKTVNSSVGSTSMSATATSGKAPTYSITGSNTANCSVDSNGTVTFTSAGECEVTAVIAEDDFYTAATAVTKKLTVNQSRAATRNRDLTPTRTGGNSTPAQVGTTGKVTLNLSEGSGSPTMTAGPSSVCKLTADGTLTFVGAGTCKVEATDPGDTTYNASSGTLEIKVVKKNGSAVLSANPSSIRVNAKSGLTLTGTYGSGDVEYSISSGRQNCSVSDNQVTGNRTGTCKVVATVKADNEFDSTTSNTVSITVTAAPSASATPTPSASPSRSATPTRSAVPTPSAAPTPVATLKPSLVLPNPVAPTVTLPVVTNSATAATNTVNIDGKVVPATQAPSDASVASRTVNDLAAESLGGFAPGAGLSIEVIGARTTGQFVVTPGVKADPVAVAAALQESSNRTSTNFAKLEKTTSVPQPTEEKIIGGAVTPDAIDLFESSALDKPITVGQLGVKSDAKWIKVDASVDTYKPGSVVYLAVTTQPIIFGAAIVGENGQVDFSGYLPVDQLSGGGHNIRIVGLRELSGVTTDENGEVVLSEDALNEIQQFDEGTKSTVKVMGANTAGGNNLVVREIPLSKFKPWWTLWFVAWTSLLLVIARRYRKVQTKKEQVVASTITVLSMLPALVLGWVTATYEIMGLGALIGFIGVALIFVIRNKRTN